MSSLEEWEEDFAKAIEGYRDSATSRLISFDSSRLYTYMKNHREEFPRVMRYVEAQDWGMLRMKNLIGQYLRRNHLRFKIEVVNGERKTGGVLYSSPKAAVFKE